MDPDVQAGELTERLVPESTVAIDVAGMTHVGQQRERNEDQFLVATLQRSLMVRETSIQAGALSWLPVSTEGTVLMVADGMGGVADGDLASSVAVRTVGEALCHVLPWVDAAAPSRRRFSGTLPGVRAGLESALVRGDAEVRRVASDRAERADMGTTVTVAYLVWPLLYVAHAGDSRCYLCRNGAMAQLTTDHTLAQKFREHTSLPIDRSSPWHHALWNVLGGGEHGAVEPEVQRVSLEDDHVILLCSDGLTKHVEDDAIAAVLSTGSTAAAACAELVARANDAGGSDNITVVVAQRQPARRSVPPSSDAPTDLLSSG